MAVKIESIRYLPLTGEFEATVIERNDEGIKVASIVAGSKSLTRLCDIIAPAKPLNI